MHKVLFILLCCSFSFAQNNDAKNSETQEVETTLKEVGIQVADTVVYTKKEINPLAPSKAAFYSAVLPGLGQVYNKKYWKVPLVYGAIGGCIYMYTYNNDYYKRFRTAFKRRKANFYDDEFQALNYSDEVLQNQQENYQKDRDLWLLVTIAAYALNVVDANVTAHLKQFNVDEDLSFDVHPFIDLDPLSQTPNYGMAVVVKF